MNTGHLDKIMALPAIGRQMLGLPDDGAFRQLTIVDNGKAPLRSYTCIVPESLHCTHIAMGVSVSVSLRSCSSGDISCWLVFGIALI